MFDTLRFADRLKGLGFESRQAEGFARALGDEMGEMGELVEHVVTKSHLDSEIGAVRSDIGTLDAKVDALDVKLDARIDALDVKLDARVDVLGARIDALDGRLGARIDALGTQIRFIFAALALLVALGLIDTLPRVLS